MDREDEARVISTTKYTKYTKKDCAMSDMIYSDEVYAIQGVVFLI